LAVDFSTVETL
jgi:putative transposase